MKFNSETFFLQSNEVYTSLCDEKSKEVFEARLMYNCTSSGSALTALRKTACKICSNAINQMDYYIIDGDKKIHYDMFHSDDELILYGAGMGGRSFYKSHNLSQRKNVLFCDRNFANIKNAPQKIISPQELFSNHTNANIIITSADSFDEIYNFLITNGISHTKIVCSVFSEQAQKVAREQYFDPIIQFNKNEVFYDVGVLNADTSITFSKKLEEYKHIYLFEPEPSSFNLSQQNLDNHKIKNATLFPYALWNKSEILHFNSGLTGNSSVSGRENNSTDTQTPRDVENIYSIDVQAVSLDEIIEDKNLLPPSYLKMDIEGSEMNVLIGAADTIRKNKPKLAICVYHKVEDIIDIPLYLKSLVPEYRFYLRHYSTLSETETVVYAVMPE